MTFSKASFFLSCFSAETQSDLVQQDANRLREALDKEQQERKKLETKAAESEKECETLKKEIAGLEKTKEEQSQSLTGQWSPSKQFQQLSRLMIKDSVKLK